MKIILITKEIKDITGRVFYADIHFDSSAWVGPENSEVRIFKGEYIVLDEEEAMIQMFNNLTGKEPEYESKLEEFKREIEALEEVIIDLSETTDNLREEIDNITGGF